MVSQCLKKEGKFAFVSVDSCESLSNLLSTSTEGQQLKNSFRNSIHQISDIDFKNRATANGFVVDYWNIEAQEYIIKDGDAFIEFLRTHFQFKETESSFFIDTLKSSCSENFDLSPEILFCILKKVM